MRDEKHQERLPPARPNHKMADAEAAPEETGRQPLSAMWRSQGPSPSRVKVYNEEALLDLIQPADIRAAALTFKWRTCTGVDMHPRTYSLLSDRALGWLSMLFGMCEYLHAIPRQVALTVFFNEGDASYPPVGWFC